MLVDQQVKEEMEDVEMTEVDLEVVTEAEIEEITVVVAVRVVEEIIAVAEDMAVVLLTQLMPSSTYPIRRELRVLTYQAIVD